jgi:uncharacterized protein (DUF58 family)
MSKPSLDYPRYMRLLPGQTAATLARLELIAHGMMEGFVAGRHRSPHKGFSIEFAEHRPYVPGDDLRNLDWRILGRKDRYYIKQYEEETNLRCTVLVDASGSMNYRGDAAAEVDGRRASKFEYAQYLAAALTYMLAGQQDAVGLVTFDTRLRTYIPPRSRASQVRLVLEELDRTEPGGETSMAAVLHDIAERIPRRGLVVIVSDFFDDPAELMKALHHFRFRRHETIVLHVMAQEELDFPFDSFTHFRDLEIDPNEVAVDPKTIRAMYLERIRAFLRELETGCGRMAVDYAPMNTRTPFDRALSGFMARRRGR